MERTTEIDWPIQDHERRLIVAEQLMRLGVVSRNVELDTTIDEQGEFEQRTYQLDAWASVWQARQDGETRGLIHLATGLGKTSVAVLDVMKFFAEREGENNPPKVLFVCHQDTILEQAEERFRTFMPSSSTAFFETKQASLPEADITFATFQSLGREMERFDRSHFDYIIYDEAHHVKAETFETLIEYFRPQFQLGLTATPERMDKKDILEHFGTILYSKTLAEAIREGLLAELEYFVVFDDAIEEAIGDDFSPKTLKELRNALETPLRNEAIAEKILAKQRELGKDRVKTMVFCQNVEQANQFAHLLNGASYHSEMPKEIVRERLKAFRNGELTTITARDMLNEGVDIPDVDLIVFLRSTASQTIFEQQLGRGLRKDKVTVLDFAATVERIKMIRQLAKSTTTQPDLPRYVPGDIYDVVFEDYSENPSAQSEDTSMESSQNAHFEFSEKVINLLDIYDEISLVDRPELNDLDDDSLIALALELSPDKPLTYKDIRNLFTAGQFLSYEGIVKRFNTLSNFQEACGFERVRNIYDLTNEELIEWALRISPDTPLTASKLIELSKNGEFVSPSTVVDRFGKLTTFQEACGFDTQPRRSYSDMTDEELVEYALELSPSKPLGSMHIRDLSKNQAFLSEAAVAKRFGSVGRFHERCGFVNQSMSKEEAIERARTLSEKAFTKSQIDELSKESRFWSITTIVKHFGSLEDFNKMCGFEMENPRPAFYRLGLTEISDYARNISPSRPLDSKDLKRLAKEGKFLSYHAIHQRFGSLKAFQEETWPHIA